MSYHAQPKTGPMKKIFVDITFLGKNEHSSGWALLCSMSVVILNYMHVTICHILKNDPSLSRYFLVSTYFRLKKDISRNHHGRHNNKVWTHLLRQRLLFLEKTQPLFSTSDFVLNCLQILKLPLILQKNILCSKFKSSNLAKN